MADWLRFHFVIARRRYTGSSCPADSADCRFGDMARGREGGREGRREGGREGRGGEGRGGEGRGGEGRGGLRVTGLRALLRALPCQTADNGRSDPNADLVDQHSVACRHRLLRSQLAPPVDHYVGTRPADYPSVLVSVTVAMSLVPVLVVTSQIP